MSDLTAPPPRHRRVPARRPRSGGRGDPVPPGPARARRRHRPGPAHRPRHLRRAARPGGPGLPAAARAERRRHRRAEHLPGARGGPLAPRRPAARPTSPATCSPATTCWPCSSGCSTSASRSARSTAASGTRPSRRCATSSATSACPPTAPAARPPSRRSPGWPRSCGAAAPTRMRAEERHPPRRPAADRQDRRHRPRRRPGSPTRALRLRADAIAADLARRIEGRLVAHRRAGVPDQHRRRLGGHRGASGPSSPTAPRRTCASRCRSTARSTPDAAGVSTYFYGSEAHGVTLLGRRAVRRAGAARDRRPHRPARLRTHAKTWDLLRRTRMPAVRVDAGYLTNPGDAARLVGPDVPRRGRRGGRGRRAAGLPRPRARRPDRRAPARRELRCGPPSSD